MFLSRYLQFSRRLFVYVAAEWLPFFSDEDRENCFDIFFLGSSRNDAHHIVSWLSTAALTALASALSWCQDAFSLQHIVRLLKVINTFMRSPLILHVVAVGNLQYLQVWIGSSHSIRSILVHISSHCDPEGEENCPDREEWARAVAEEEAREVLQLAASLPDRLANR